MSHLSSIDTAISYDSSELTEFVQSLGNLINQDDIKLCFGAKSSIIQDVERRIEEIKPSFLENGTLPSEFNSRPVKPLQR